ncbi:MAG: PQQ-binding-like beta-propeller repeat protein [Phycisphaerae bacterium]|jgi:outer membrane protein assembly factor BamB|nr:PQQ-binding-like beta-propeller repeat protein [Phycisphaerae bacterium]|tara:strand:- start:622 stop:3702 length:3081 start_codon:yes stop_codon:yes gene_type:complete
MKNTCAIPFLSVVNAVLLACLTVPQASVNGSDWPAYHCDVQRSGYTSEAVTDELKLAWSFKLPHAPTPAWSRNGRIRYDDVFQPVVAGDSVFFGDHAEGMLRVIDLKTGREKWRFQTDGPIRCAPTVWKGSVIVGSDDGRIYSLKVSDGSVRWSIRPGPSDELVLGNGYMISKWPVRGAPTVEGDTVYVGAGLWPSDGFYLLAVDADTGKVKWRNDDSGRLSLRQPHGALSKAGPAAQGYLTLSETSILVPPGRSLPAMFDKKTGQFRYIEFGGKIGGGVSMTYKDTYTCAGVLWTLNASRKVRDYLPMKQISEWPMIETLPHDAMTSNGIVAARESQVQSFKWATKQRVRKRDGKVLSTEDYTSLDGEWSVKASGAVSELIVAGEHIILGLNSAIELVDRKTRKKLTVADGLDGTVGGLAYANGTLIASTTTGWIYGFTADGQAGDAPVISNKQARPEVDAETVRRAKAILEAAGTDKGYALDLGCGDGSLSIALTQFSDMNVIAVEPDKALFASTLNRLKNAGLYGTRVMIFNRPLDATGLPNMLANLIVSRRDVLRGAVLTEARRTQRPYGGVLCTGMGDRMSFERRGELKGAGSWTHQYANPANTLCSNDAAVSGELTMLWYRDYDLPSASRWWKPPAPLADKGILYHSCPNGLIAVDAYNGTEIWRFESKDLLSTQAGLYVLRTGGVYCLGDGMLYLRIKARCLCLNTKTGELVRTISLPDPKAHDFWGYLAYSDGIIYGTAANTSHSTTNPYPYDRHDSINEGKTFFAIDAKSGRVLWQFEPKDHIGNTAVAIDDRNVYVIDRTSIWWRTRKEEQDRRRGSKSPKPTQSGRLIALDKKTGAVKWADNTHVFGSAVLVSGPARRVCVWHEDKMTGFDTDTGKHVYSIQSPYNFNVYVNRAPAIVGDVIHWVRYAFDLQSGKKLVHELQRSYGCGSVSASRNMLFFRSGTIGYVDLNAPRANNEKITTGDIQNFGGIRPGCYINIVPAGGVVLVPDTSSSCRCSYFNQCWIALQPAGHKQSR